MTIIPLMRKKQRRFQENTSLDLVIETGKPSFSAVARAWQRSYFYNTHPITLEIGAGRGEYSVALAKMYPERNFIANDIKGDRLWYGAREAEKDGLKNIAFLRYGAERLREFFNEGDIAEIWITFPGPHPKKSQANRRLTHPNFLAVYKYLLKKGGVVHVKTDSLAMHQFSKRMLKQDGCFHVLEADTNIYRKTSLSPELCIKTHFEERFLRENKSITYLKAVYTGKKSILRRILDALPFFKYDNSAF